MTAPEAERGIAFEQVSVQVEDLGADPRTPVTRTLLADISCTLQAPLISMIGANGSGKSTFLQLCNGLLEPSSGTVRINGLDTVRHGRRVRQAVGFVFTDPAAQLVMPTPLEDVELSLRRSVPNRRQRRAQALDVLEELGVAELAQRSVYELSGGQRQLVALATVLAVDPQVLVLDEPTTLLDLGNRELLRTTLRRLVDTRGVQILLSTHDLELAGDAAQTLLIDQGQLVAEGEPDAVIAQYRARVLS